jgi:hypothetical protein
MLRSTPRVTLGLGLGLGLSLALILSVAVTTPLAIPDLGPDPGPDPEARTARAQDPGVEEDALHGLWMRYDTRGEGDPLRFWYFHGDGKGLYRYGKVGLANTHSFDYEVEVSTLFMRMRKTGAEHMLELELGRDDQGRTWLALHDDPYEPGARYYRVESELDFAGATRAWAPDPEGSPERAAGDAGLGDRIWIDYQRFATGGVEFHMYQLAATAIDGRGVGWFHRGDFDDWSTESLTYRIDGDRLELFFDLREEPNVTPFEIVSGPKGRELVLEADPRDYWATHRYQDGGRSFGTSAFDVVLGAEAVIAGLELGLE